MAYKLIALFIAGPCVAIKQWIKNFSEAIEKKYYDGRE